MIDAAEDRSKFSSRMDAVRTVGRSWSPPLLLLHPLLLLTLQSPLQSLLQSLPQSLLQSLPQQQHVHNQLA